jgi:sterol desaturase/sphingolipid hydroxylase (fatty acid hydroxylase superfamily)
MIDAWVNANAERAQMLLFLVLFVLFALAEAVEPRRPGPMRRRARWGANLALTALNVAVLPLLPVSFLGVALWAGEHRFGLLNQLTLSTGWLVVATLLGRGFISFATHYLMHKVALLWRFHRVHHLDTELDVSTTVRFHPAELFLGLVPGVPLVALLGLTPWVLLLYEVLDAGVNVLSHANVALPRRLERVLRYVIVTPDLHRVHHSSWQTETDSNFGAVFPVWDLVFGTFRATTRQPQESMELGLEEVRDERASRLGWLLVSPALRLGPRRQRSGAGGPRPQQGDEGEDRPGPLEDHEGEKADHPRRGAGERATDGVGGGVGASFAGQPPGEVEEERQQQQRDADRPDPLCRDTHGAAV